MTLKAASANSGSLAANLLASDNTWTNRNTFNPSTAGQTSIGIPAGVQPTSPRDGDLWYNSATQSFESFTDGIIGKIERSLAVLVGAVTVANTTTETTILQVTLPANYFVAGRDVRIGSFGFHTASASPTARVRVYKGATVLLDTGARNSGVSTNDLFEMRAHITGQSATSVWAQGFYSELGGGVNQFQMVNTAATTISAASEIMKVTFQWGTASAGDTITWTNMVIEEK